MTTPGTPPAPEAFLEAPAADIAAIAPATALYLPGGTRRAAALAGIDPASDAYPRHSLERLMAVAELFFEHGVSHLFTGILRGHRRTSEGAATWERMVAWIDALLASESALRAYAERGWRVRLVGGEGDARLSETAARLVARATPAGHSRTLWCFVTLDDPWEALLAAARAGARTQAELVRALYGEEIPLATLLVSFGKPMAGGDLYPPAIAGELHAYWTQRPGYSLTAQELRAILYDYAYLRATRGQGAGRYAEVAAQREIWERPHILGLGRRHGGFWYPREAPHEQRA